jgi:superfamily II DNA/RNA helicase
VLHGGLSGLERRQVLELFNNDETCRVFLSTDAGGTGLNLQVADTVVNLELPWNPAVLEQRIARVHRMGQDQPVRVINFVTRGTIEENVLRAMEVKRGLFASLFESADDEVTMTTGHQRQFIQTLQELVNEAQPKPEPVSQELSNLLGDKGLPLVETALPLLETLAKWLRSPEVQPHLTDDMKQRLTRLLR